jgi:PST family polysaccharide transporter
MSLMKTSVLNAISIVIKMATLLGINKIIAHFFGPSGFAIVGQFQNFTQMANLLASGAINTGVTKYTAEYIGDNESKVILWNVAFSYMFFCSIICSIFICFFSNEISTSLFSTIEYDYIICIFSVSLLFFSLNSFLLSILNGLKDIRGYIISNIAGSFFSFVFVCVLSVKFKFSGALIGLAIYQSLSFFITLFFCYQQQWFSPTVFRFVYNWSMMRNLSKFAIMGVASAICLPVAQMVIRNLLIHDVGIDAAGNWEAMLRLSNAYLTIITTSVSFYLLPRFSEIKKSSELANEMSFALKVIIPLSLLIILFVYLFRDVLISFLFSDRFVMMRDLFIPQLIGDFFRVISIIFAYHVIGRANFKLYVFNEIFFNFLFCFLTYIFVDAVGFLGVCYAYALSYFFCFVFLGLNFIIALKREIACEGT